MGLGLGLGSAFMVRVMVRARVSTLLALGLRIMPPSLKPARCSLLTMEVESHLAEFSHQPLSHGAHGKAICPCTTSFSPVTLYSVSEPALLPPPCSVPSKPCSMRPTLASALEGVPCVKSFLISGIDQLWHLCIGSEQSSGPLSWCSNVGMAALVFTVMVAAVASSASLGGLVNCMSDVVPSGRCGAPRVAAARASMAESPRLATNLVKRGVEAAGPLRNVHPAARVYLNCRVSILNNTTHGHVSPMQPYHACRSACRAALRCVSAVACRLCMCQGSLLASNSS